MKCAKNISSSLASKRKTGWNFLRHTLKFSFNLIRSRTIITATLIKLRKQLSSRSPGKGQAVFK